MGKVRTSLGNFLALVIAVAIFQVICLTKYVTDKDDFVMSLSAGSRDIDLEPVSNGSDGSSSRRSVGHFKNFAVSESPVDECKCVDCDEEEDSQCGGLWKAIKYPGDDTVGDSHSKQIHMVVSHCMADLHWIENYFALGFNIASVHIISKCGHPVNGAPANSTIEILPNVGRCDHSYAYYINSVLDQKLAEYASASGGIKKEKDDSVVIFLKDDMSVKNRINRQPGLWNKLDPMVRVASSTNGFSCGIVLPDSVRFYPGKKRHHISAYHDVKSMFAFNLDEYDHKIDVYANDTVPFKSQYANLGMFYESLIQGTSEPSLPGLVQVCYGGIFAASVRNIRRVDASVWTKVEQKLSRGNSIEEGHYMERLWGPLLSTALQPSQIKAVLNHTEIINEEVPSFMGVLLRTAIHQGGRNLKKRQKEKERTRRRKNSKSQQ